MISRDSIIAILEKYYASVDDQQLEILFSLFHQDIVYTRGSQTIEGMDAFKRFYQEGRVIHKGRHTLHHILVDYPGAAIQGHFSGILKDGEAVEIEFADFFRFEKGKIIWRETYFQGREV